jgi:hypothetical protein
MPTSDEHDAAGPPRVCLVLYELHLKHLCATMWNWTWEFAPQSLQRIHTWL